jgi:hypothetical protein
MSNVIANEIVSAFLKVNNKYSEYQLPVNKVLKCKQLKNKKIIFAWELNNGEYFINEIVDGEVNHLHSDFAGTEEDILDLFDEID